MLKAILKLLLGSVLLIATQACAPLGTSTPDTNSINTAIAQTMAAMTQTPQPGIPITGPSSTPTLSPQTPIATPTAMLSPSPIVSATSSAPQVSVSVATNCRVGPSVAYDRVGALLVGEVAEVVGRNGNGTYWVIRNPDRPGELCWLWGQFATVTGNANALPLVTPPPLPTPTATPSPIPTPLTQTPNFIASYSGKENCTGTGWWVDIQLGNSSGISFQSISMTVKDATTNTSLPLSSDDFTNKNGCNESDTRDTLPPSAILMVSSPVFTYDPSGHELSATITLCSDPGQNGACVTKAINFTP